MVALVKKVGRKLDLRLLPIGPSVLILYMILREERFVKVKCCLTPEMKVKLSLGSTENNGQGAIFSIISEKIS